MPPKRGCQDEQGVCLCPISHGVAAGHVLMAEVTCEDMCCCSLGPWEDQGAWSELG